MQKSSNRRNKLARYGALVALRESAMVAIAMSLFGFVFGVLAKTQDFTLFDTAAMSGLLYAGSVQMVALSIWNHDHLNLVALLSTAFIVTLRFLLMGATLVPLFKDIPKRRVYPALFFLVDEVWAMTLLKKQKKFYGKYFLFGYFICTSIVFYLSWLVSSMVGSLLGAYVTNPEKFGFDFAFVAIFLSLLIGVRRGKQDIIPWTIAGIVAILAAHYIHGGPWYIILGALSGSLVGVWREYH